jgi:hypothetical protein
MTDFESERRLDWLQKSRYFERAGTPTIYGESAIVGPRGRTLFDRLRLVFDIPRSPERKYESGGS